MAQAGIYRGGLRAHGEVRVVWARIYSTEVGCGAAGGAGRRPRGRQTATPTRGGIQTTAGRAAPAGFCGGTAAAWGRPDHGRCVGTPRPRPRRRRAASGGCWAAAAAAVAERASPPPPPRPPRRRGVSAARQASAPPRSWSDGRCATLAPSALGSHRVVRDGRAAADGPLPSTHGSGTDWTAARRRDLTQVDAVPCGVAIHG